MCGINKCQTTHITCTVAPQQHSIQELLLRKVSSWPHAYANAHVHTHTHTLTSCPRIPSNFMLQGLCTETSQPDYRPSSSCGLWPYVCQECCCSCKPSRQAALSGESPYSHSHLLRLTKLPRNWTVHACQQLPIINYFLALSITHTTYTLQDIQKSKVIPDTFLSH